MKSFGWGLMLAISVGMLAVAWWLGIWAKRYFDMSSSTESAIHDIAGMVGLGSSAILVGLALLPWALAFTRSER